MPELPEVETIGRALKTFLVGRSFLEIAVYSPKLREPLDSLHEPELIGKRVLDVRRRGRYLVVELEDRHALLMHFGMSGVLKICPLSQARAKHEHVIFDIGKGESLRFECPRRFSLLKAVRLRTPGAEPEELATLGVEPLSEAFSGMYLGERAGGRSLAVKEFLMDNHVVTGIGNIYATEALFAAGISPLRKAKEITEKEAEVLVREVKKILLQSIAMGGTTFSDYRKLDGSTGKYGLDLKVYGHRNGVCPRCGNKLTCVTQGGRSSVYCPCCQH